MTDFSLIETLRWDPEAGLVRGERHLGRMAGSASALGFVFSRDALEAALRDATGGESQLRVRAELSAEGEISVTTAPFQPLAHGTIWKVGIADVRLDSADWLIRHKTTRRGIYEAARAEFVREDADEVILLNERGEVCEGTITNIFVRVEERAPLVTPAAGCGLLPGILREEMLESGEAVEARLTVEDLRSARELFCGNSLRGLIPAATV